MEPVEGRICLPVQKATDNKEILDDQRGPTKKEFLRIRLSVFHPLGFLACYMINVKILLQDIWRAKIGWDEEISQNSRIRWDKWMSLSMVGNLKNP